MKRRGWGASASVRAGRTALFVGVLSGCSTGDRPTTETRRPNILLLVADDLAYSDLGVLGSEIRTPNLDALARDGRILTNFHVSPACSPTRAMLFSGTDSHLAGLGSMAGELDDNQKGQPGYEGYLSDRVVSVASLLRDAGYQTYMAGKWHLGVEEPQGPHRRGFERSFALLSGGASHFSDALPLTESDAPAPYREDGRPARLPEDFYSTNFYTDRLIEYIRDGLENERPFFAYAAYTSPHWPLQVPDDELDRYRGVYDGGWDELRRKRQAGLENLGLVATESRTTPRLPWVAEWGSLASEEQRRESRKMELYAAMVENLDANIGRLIDFLQESGVYDDTFVLFFSDNGAEGNPIQHLAGEEWLARRFDDRLENMGRRDSYVFYGPGWAQATTAPYRYFKTFPTEGGIRVPAIVRFRGAGTAAPFQDAFASVMDVAPTLLDLAGASRPGSRYEGRDVLPMKGVSLLPFLEGKAESVHETDYVTGWELFGRRAIRQGDWKLVWLGEPYGDGQWGLYDVAEDPAESNNLALEHPDRVRELETLWDAYAKDNGVILPTRDMGYANETLPVE